MTVISKVLGVFKGRVAKLAGAVGATLLLAPIPALGFTFLSQWSTSSLTVNAATPVSSSVDFGSGTELIVDMGKNGITTAPVTTGQVNQGAISFFTAQRDISVTGSGENVNVVRSYQTLLQGASMQSIVYFQQITGANPGGRVDITPNTFNTAGARFGRTFSGLDNPAQNVNLGPGTYTIFVRLKYKKDRFGIWDNSESLPGSPHTFTISSAVGP
jgi:hypothetical protein